MELPPTLGTGWLEAAPVTKGLETGWAMTRVTDGEKEACEWRCSE